MTTPRPTTGSGGEYLPSSIGFFNSMPDWLKALVMIMVAPFLAVAMAGIFLQVNVNEYLDTYMEIQLEAMKVQSGASTDAIIDAINLQLGDLAERIGQTEFAALTNAERISILEAWACEQSAMQGLNTDAPKFCVIE